jgi:hypothetical protein
MQILAQLPTWLSDQVTSPLIQQFWQDLEHPPHIWVGQQFRSADGSNNSHIYPHIGKSMTPYARMVTSKTVPMIPTQELPDPDELFTDLMKRSPDVFTPHPSAVNSALFYLAILITHDLFHSDPSRGVTNQTTHYADMSYLYGATQADQTRVRFFQRGIHTTPSSRWRRHEDSDTD